MFTKKSKVVDTKHSLQRFLESKKDSLSRARHLRHAISHTADPLERKRILEEHCVAVFYVFHDLFVQLESMLAFRSSNKIPLSEINETMELLHLILIYLPELLCKRWQFNCLASIFKRLLHPKATNSLRLRYGLKFFIIWYAILGCGPYGTDEIDPIFAALIPDWQRGYCRNSKISTLS